MLPDVSHLDVINQSHIDELMPREQENGGLLIKRLYQIYAEEAPRLLEELRQALAAKDEEACGDVVHQMKGSAAAMGATRVFAVTEAALGLCREGKCLEIEGLAESIEAETEHFMRRLEALLDGVK